MRARLEKDSEQVVVATGSVVGKDERPQVGRRHSTQRKVEATALAQARAAFVPRGAAVGPIERDQAAPEREARRADRGKPAVEDAAALAVAAVAANAAGAAGGRVQDDDRVGEGADRPDQIAKAATLARPAGTAQEAAAALVAAGAAVGPVRDEQTAADVPISELITQAAPLASAPGAAVPAAAAVAARAADRFVALEQAIADMKGRAESDPRGAGRVGDGTARAVACAAAVAAVATVAT